MEAAYSLDGVQANPVAGAADLEGKILEITYPLGSTGVFAGIGEKKLTFHNDFIKVDVEHQGSFTEILPLVVQSTSFIQIDHQLGVIQLYRLGRLGYEKLRIEIANPFDVESITMLDARSLGNGMSVQPVHIIAGNKLSYTITFNPQEPLPTTTTGDLLLTNAPEMLRLKGVYPNPSDSYANIAFELDALSKVKLEIYNLPGEKVFSKNYGYFERGSHAITFDRGHLASGIYYFRIKGAGKFQTRPVILK
jgi:hypothetical protein